MDSHSTAPIHMIDLIRRKRDDGAVTAAELAFIAEGAASETIPVEQLAAWLMAACIRGLNRDEIRALTLAMRDSGEKFSTAGLGKTAVDKHSTGGVGDKTSFLVAPIAAACGLAVPMISGRALGHTGGTLDKLESIPGYRTALSLAEFESVLQRCGCSIIGQTRTLVPADRVLYALRDRTGTVENPGLICASILSKKLAAGLNTLVLDVKTGSGAFLRNPEQCEYLAALMVATAEAAGTRTVALLTAMDEPLGHAAGNWIEIAESVELLRGQRPPASEHLRRLSIVLAGFMVHLGGKASTPEAGCLLAEAALFDGSALAVFLRMIEAQGGDLSVFDDLDATHKPAVTHVLEAEQTGYVASMDTTEIGWAVQRTGAGRERAGELVDPHAGIDLHIRLGDRVEPGQPLATFYASSPAHLAEPIQRLKAAIRFSDAPPPPQPPQIRRIFTHESAEAYLANAVR